LAERIEGSKNLIKCQIEISDKKRQIVAGIGKYYKPEDLIGKTVIVVENLKPATIKGVLSEGMLLAAEDKEGIILLTTDKPISPGAPVKWYARRYIRRSGYQDADYQNIRASGNWRN